MNPLLRPALLLALLLGLCASAHAQVVAPRFLPGQPMVVGDQVLMMWGPVPGAAQYAVFHNGREIARVASNQYLGVLPKEPGEHRFQVAAVTAVGVLGLPGEPGVIRVRHIGKPGGVIARASTATGSIDLIWNKVEGALIYNVYRSRPGQDRQLVASVQEETFKDAQVAGGEEYTYEITAKDLSGQEGPRSAAVGATLVAGMKQAEDRVVFRALPTTEVFSLTYRRPPSRTGHLPGHRAGPQPLGGGPEAAHHPQPGRQRRAALHLGPVPVRGHRVPADPPETGPRPGGKTYVSDAINGVLACLDPQGVLLWARGIPTPPVTQRELWEEFPEHMKSQLATPSSVLCREGELWITDQRFQLIYRLDYQGKVLGHITHYLQDGERLRLPGVGELFALEKTGATLLTFPLSHRAVAVDEGAKVVARFGGQVRGYMGGFVGIHGVSPWEEGKVLLTDPAVASLQVFDAASGRYLYHISGPEPRPDPVYAQRADLPLRKPNLAMRAGDGKLWVYDAATRRISVRRMSGVATPPLDGG
ncbi:MAG: hypothetical protein P1P84_13575 [Deferrisomatales bacterium]|nr:hypothetical protein [Deferrisomatales bacterium]